MLIEIAKPAHHGAVVFNDLRDLLFCQPVSPAAGPAFPEKGRRAPRTFPEAGLRFLSRKFIEVTEGQCLVDPGRVMRQFQELRRL